MGRIAQAFPDVQAAPPQWAKLPSPSTTCWPVVQAVAGEAVIVFITVNLLGGSELAGVHVPGIPAVAPVEAGPLLLKPGIDMSTLGETVRNCGPVSVELLQPGAG